MSGSTIWSRWSTCLIFVLIACCRSIIWYQGWCHLHQVLIFHYVFWCQDCVSDSGFYWFLSLHTKLQIVLFFIENRLFSHTIHPSYSLQSLPPFPPPSSPTHTLPLSLRSTCSPLFSLQVPKRWQPGRTKTRHKTRQWPSDQGWTRQVSWRKRVSRAGKRVRDALTLTLGILQEHQADSHNIYTEDMMWTHSVPMIASVSCEPMCILLSWFSGPRSPRFPLTPTIFPKLQRAGPNGHHQLTFFLSFWIMSGCGSLHPFPSTSLSDDYWTTHLSVIIADYH